MRMPSFFILILTGTLVSAQIALSVSPGGMIIGWLGFALTLVLLFRYRAAHPFPRFGPANGVTLIRAGLACLLFGFLIPPTPSLAALSAAPLGGLALLADGLDGWLARRTGLASVLGARFDMETDAALILALALLAALLTPVGAWIILSGCLRYLFVTAMFLWPWLAAPLPPRPNRRRQCVVQAGSLVLLLIPAWTDPLSDWIGAAGLATALWSFAVDSLWLYRHRKPRS